MGKKSDKKVLFLASWYPSKENTTTGNFVQKHAELANEVSNIDVLYATVSKSVEEITVVDELINNVRTVIVYYPPIKSNVPFLSTILKKETYLFALRKGYKYLDTQYDLVHLNAAFPAGLFAKWLKKQFNIPYIVTVHWSGFLTHNFVYDSLPFYIKRAYQSIFRSANKVLPVSDHLGKSLKERGLINEFTVLNNVVKSTYFYPNVEQKSEMSSNRFLHISTFDNDHKNISGMLSSFSKLKKKYVLHLVTEGEKSDVWTLIKKYNIPKENCVVESKLPAEKIGEAMRAADCLVSFSNYETFSVVLAEAWMSGIPAIYSKCGGLTEINNVRIGVQVQPKDQEALSEALEYFSRMNYDSISICDFAEQFSETYVKKMFCSLY